jgi:hypothetical protein
MEPQQPVSDLRTSSQNAAFCRMPVARRPSAFPVLEGTETDTIVLTATFVANIALGRLKEAAGHCSACPPETLSHSGPFVAAAGSNW